MTKQIMAEVYATGTFTHSQNLVIVESRLSTKFLLPDGGRLLNDPEFKALDESQPLRLPFQLIALEYYRGNLDPSPGLHKSSKVIIFACENEEGIALTQVSWMDEVCRWVIAGTVLIPRTGYIDRSNIKNGQVLIKFSHPSPPAKLQDFSDEVGSLLSFLNILQCSNVNVECSPPRKEKGKKIKAALKFDTYHILTIDAHKANFTAGVSIGPHRSPREHLRRGHIRRLADGRKIWVNAAVVGAGKGAGVVSKDYALRLVA